MPPTTTFGVSPASTLLLSNRFEPLAEPPQDEEKIEPHPEFQFQAQGIYQPPHVRTHFESVASTTGSDPTADDTSTDCGGHGSEFDCGDKTTSHLQTLRTNSPTVPLSQLVACLEEIEEMKKKMDQQAEVIRRITEEAETKEKALLEQESRNAALTKKIHDHINSQIILPPEPSTTKPLGIKTAGMDSAHVNLGPLNGGAQRTHHRDILREILTAPTHPSVTRPGAQQTGGYINSTPVTALAHNTPSSTFVHPATTRQRVEVQPGITGNQRSLPPRFQRPPQDFAQYNHRQILPQNRISNNSLFAPIPPPRPHSYDVNKTSGSEGVAQSSLRSCDVFIEAYLKANGLPQNQEAWVAWRQGVVEAERRHQCEYQRAIEREEIERRATASRLRCSSNLMRNVSASDPGYSSSGTSTRVASSRNSVRVDGGSVETSVLGPNGEGPHYKWWKDVADNTWAFGKSAKPDEFVCMTEVVQKPGWQVTDPPEEWVSVLR